MSTDVYFGNASGDYGRGTPNRMEHPILHITRGDTHGHDSIIFPRKGEPFTVQVDLFGSSQAEVMRKVATWQNHQAWIGSLTLPQGTVPNCELQRVRKASGIHHLVNSTSGATHMQRLALVFLQLSEQEDMSA
ncbi:MAG: hypothetical protein R6V05_06015 [Candidatus Brocadiia bacterium]